jgi:hypothetical protein
VPSGEAGEAGEAMAGARMERNEGTVGVCAMHAAGYLCL